jgi:hypothetical protein
MEPWIHVERVLHVAAEEPVHQPEREEVLRAHGGALVQPDVGEWRGA